MKRLVLMLVWVLLPFMAQAAAPSQQSVEQLLTLLQAEKILDVVKPQLNSTMKASLEQALQGRKPSPEEQQVIDSYRAKLSQVMADQLTMARLQPLYVQLYTQYFTQEEVDGLIAFYQSPAGRSMVVKMPQLMQGLMAALPAFMAPALEQIRTLSQQMAKDLQALKTKAATPNS